MNLGACDLRLGKPETFEIKMEKSVTAKGWHKVRSENR